MSPVPRRPAISREAIAGALLRWQDGAIDSTGLKGWLDEAGGVPAGVKLATLEDLIAKSDFITLHVPLVPETKNLFDLPTIGKMKKGSYLINCSRGGMSRS